MSAERIHEGLARCRHRRVSEAGDGELALAVGTEGVVVLVAYECDDGVELAVDEVPEDWGVRGDEREEGELECTCNQPGQHSVGTQRAREEEGDAASDLVD